ncbi:MAG: amylo-alpha-1,6-glucosidase [Terriglobia bacterium]
MAGRFAWFLFLLFSISVPASTGTLGLVERFPTPPSDIALSGRVQPAEPFNVTGPHGALFGNQNGIFEAWIYPVKLLSDFRITAELENYPVPLAVNEMASRIVVNPESTIITYSHIAFTLRQIMFAPRGQRGLVVLFDVDSIRPLKLRFSFSPEMKLMWPAGSGFAYPQWDDEESIAIFHTDRPNIKGLIAVPFSSYDTLLPYQEHSREFRFNLVFHYDPQKHSAKYLPILVTASMDGQEALYKGYRKLAHDIPRLYQETKTYYDRFFDDKTVVETPDSQFDLALKWAMVAIEKCRVRFGHKEGLIAGYHASGHSARPGFAWFFGRDTLWTLFAVHSYGDFALAQEALAFLIKRQRGDGKIMHEFSQTAELVDWEADFPYFYAAADATPLFVILMNDYLQASGDLEFIRAHWAAIQAAYEYGLAHDADGDGIYENTASGHGWVEGGPLGNNHQELYLAALWADSLRALSQMAAAVNETALAKQARSQYEAARNYINQHYWNPEGRYFSFGKSEAGNFDGIRTIMPAVALWNGLLASDNTHSMLDSWAAAEFSTDWGTRLLSRQDPKYDPISYHNGSVWPLFTGWVALAEYSYGRPLAGFTHLRQNSFLTYSHLPGSVTEVLSGEYFRPFARSSPQQMWSSAMVLAPALRGLLGLRGDARQKVLSFAPQLPAHWDWVRIRNFKLGKQYFDLSFRKDTEKHELRIQSRGGATFTLHFSPGLPLGSEIRQTRVGSGATESPQEGLLLVQPGRELMLIQSLSPGVEVRPVAYLPQAGDPTQSLKIVRSEWSDGALTLWLDGRGGASYEISLKTDRAVEESQGAKLVSEQGGWKRLRVDFPGSQRDFRRKTVTIRFR